MFGSADTRRPLLLLLVFGVFLAIIGITATAQSVMVSLHFSTGTLNTVVGSDSATVRAILNAFRELRYLDPAPGRERERAALEAQLAALTRPEEILRVELRRLDGTIVAASSPGLAGTRDGLGRRRERVSRSAQRRDRAFGRGRCWAGRARIARRPPRVPPHQDRRRGPRRVGIWRDAAPVLARLDESAGTSSLVTLSAAIIAAMLLFLIFRSAQGRLTRQTAALVDATRRDALTDDAQSRRARRAPRGGDRAGPNGRVTARSRPHRHRQLPSAQRQPRPPRRRPGPPRGRRRAGAASRPRRA